MKRRRVAFVSVLPAPYQRDLFAALAQRPELELSVFYMGESDPDSPWPEKPLAPYEHYLPGFCLRLGSRRIHCNWPLGRLAEFDVVVLNTIMSVTAQFLTRAFLRGKPWLFWGERLGEGGRLHRALAAPLHRAVGIAGIGTWAHDDYARRFPEPKQYNIPYHCDLSEFLAQPRRNREGGEVVFLFCGQMIARKGVDLLLKAFSSLDARARLLLVGREAELPRLLEALTPEVRSRVSYAGFQAPENLPQFFAHADVFVLPSRYDGWGVVVNQALGAGLPVVCSDMVGAGFDLVTEGENGFRFPAGNAEALHGCLRRFLEEPLLIEEFGRASRNRAERWDPARGAERWVDALFEAAP